MRRCACPDWSHWNPTRRKLYRDAKKVKKGEYSDNLWLVSASEKISFSSILRLGDAYDAQMKQQYPNVSPADTGVQGEKLGVKETSPQSRRSHDEQNLTSTIGT